MVANFVTTRVRREFYPPPPPCGGCPHVAMGIATLIGHRMTSSHSSKDPLRPPVSGGENGPLPASPRVALGSAPLPRHRWTFSPSSKDLARPLWEGVVTTDLCPISRTLYPPSLTGREGVGPEGPWLGLF